MLKLFRKVQWRTVSASNIRPGDVVSDTLEGEVLYVFTQTYSVITLVTFVINMPKKMFGSRIGTITVPLDKQIRIAQR